MGREAGGVVATAPATPQPHSPTPRRHRRPVTAKVLAIVADKTGYPEDMLELDLDMEADLGIDTVKQAETFASVREAFDIPAAGKSESARLSDAGERDRVSCAPCGRIWGAGGERRGAWLRLRPTSPQPNVPTTPADDRRHRHRPRSSPSSPTRPATPRTCWNSTWTWKPTWASTRSSRPRPSPPSARRSTSRCRKT